MRIDGNQSDNFTGSLLSTSTGVVAAHCDYCLMLSAQVASSLMYEKLHVYYYYYHGHHHLLSSISTGFCQIETVLLEESSIVIRVRSSLQQMSVQDRHISATDAAKDVPISKTRATIVLDPAQFESTADQWDLPVVKTASLTSNRPRIENELVSRWSDTKHRSTKCSNDLCSSFVALPSGAIQTRRNEVLGGYLKGRALSCSIQEELLPLTMMKTAKEIAQLMLDAVSGEVLPPCSYP
ncbi:hypothetical protein DFJ43DRAFT_554901 [Lentinula guzmanii]|uniref:Uncharacterized protein n=1 Tax=Lentinula guzmanii TaxID=2804957 RepID=A0AA38JFZ7_9AGAR|nr:hypothetical protein DFJ43DRAFT_554901 [Lentinula guzmanii]